MFNDSADFDAKFNLVPGDTSGLKSIDAGRQQMVDFQKATEKTDSALQRMTKNAAASLRLTAEEIKKNHDAMERLRAEALEEMTRPRALPQSAGGNVSDIRGAGAISSLAGMLGAGELSAGFGLVDAITNASREIPGFVSGIDAWGKKLAEQKGIVGEMASAGAALSSVLPGVSAGMASVLAVAGPVAAAVAIAAAALSSLSETAAAANAATDAMVRRRDVLREIRDQELTAAEIEERLANARQREADAAANITQQTEILNQTFSESQKQFGDFFARVGTLALSLGGGFESLNEDIKKSEQELISARAEIQAYEQALNSSTIAANDAAAAQKKLTDLAASTQATLDRLAEQQFALRDAYNQALGDKTLDRQIAALREQEDVQRSAAKATTDLTKRLGELGSEGFKKVEAIRTEMRIGEEKAQADILKIQADAKATEDEYMSRWAREALRRLQAHQLARARLEEDARDDILSLIRTGDLAGARDAEQQRNKSIRRAEEDRNISARQRNEDAARERDAQRALVSERIAGIHSELRVFRFTQAQRIIEEHNAAEARRETEIKAFNARMADDAAERSIRKRRQDEDQRLADGRAKRAFDAQIGRIVAQSGLESAKFARERDAIMAVQSVAQVTSTNAVASASASRGWWQQAADISNQAISAALRAKQIVDGYRDVFNRMFTTPAPSAPSTNLMPFGQTRIPMLDTGGIAMRPTLAVIAERRPEAVIPLEEMSRYAGGTSGPQIVIQTRGMFDGVVLGGAATIDDLQSMSDYLLGEVGTVLHGYNRLLRGGR